MLKKSLTKYLILFSLIIAFVSCGDLGSNRPSKETYPVRGVDVSHHQGYIDWDDVAKEDIQFVYIKATEGENFRDSLFQFNIQNAGRVGFKTGAYHFYRASKDPLLQASNYISTVPREYVILPPVIDIEFPADLKTDKTPKQIAAEIYSCLKELEIYYRIKPVIYTDYYSYDNFLKPAFTEYEIWIRDIEDSPQLSDNRSWHFWQHSNKGLVKGISGLVDLNVYNGSRSKFDSAYRPVK